MPIKHKISNASRKVLKQLHEAGYEAYIVGGAVRDFLLDIEPKDYDIATNATPEEVKAVFGRKARIIGRRFRLVHVYIERTCFEVSTFRREPTLEERKGRDNDSGLMVWRDNMFGSLEEDARRRDFTVNSIYYDPENQAHEFEDFVGGIDDIKAKCVRAIGDPYIRIQEDPIRMIRACKLVGQYNFTLEPELAKAISQNADKLKLCSNARTLEELYKILKKPYCAPTFEALHAQGLLKYLLPKLSKAWLKDEGKMVQHLLATRDSCMKNDNGIFPSRVTGLSLMVLPFLRKEFPPDKDGLLWYNFAGVDKKIQHKVRAFLGSYRVPKYIIAKIRDSLILQPKLLAGTHCKKVQRHPEYPRARDLFVIYSKAMNLDEKYLAKWPDQDKLEKKKQNGSK